MYICVCVYMLIWGGEEGVTMVHAVYMCGCGDFHLQSLQAELSQMWPRTRVSV